jgi:hypothetical protein
MNETFLGLGLAYWALPCLMLAGMWSFFWPSYRGQKSSGLPYLLLRWGHALTWLLLALALFVSGTGRFGGGMTGGILGIGALVIYLAFLYMLLQPQPPVKS